MDWGGVQGWLTAAWEWLLDKEHRAALGFVGTAAAAVVVAGWAVFVHFHKTDSEPSAAPARAASEEREDLISGEITPSSATQDEIASGHTSRSNFPVLSRPGISPKEYATVVEELAIYKSAAKSLFKSIGENLDLVPLEDLDSKFRVVARKLKDLEQDGEFLANKLKQVPREELPIGELERVELLSKELGVTEAATKSFLRILESKHVPREDLDSTLREIANRYKELEQKLARFTSDDSDVVALKQGARQAVSAGDFPRAEALLLEAMQKDIAAARALQERAQERLLSAEKSAVDQGADKASSERLLSAAKAAAELGALRNAQLAYEKAALYYAEAADLVPQNKVLVRVDYLNREGEAWLEAGQYVKAGAALTQALSIGQKELGEEHTDVADSLDNLGVVSYSQGRYMEAEALLKRALGIREKALGSEHPDVAVSLINLALIYQAQGRYAEAEPLYKRALQIREKALGPEHPDVATSLDNLGSLYRSLHQYGESEMLARRAQAIREKALGSEHPDVAVSLNNLALIYQAQGRYAEAEPLYKRALWIVEEVLGSEHPTTITMRENYEKLLAEMGEGERSN